MIYKLILREYKVIPMNHNFRSKLSSRNIKQLPYVIMEAVFVWYSFYAGKYFFILKSISLKPNIIVLLYRQSDKNTPIYTKDANIHIESHNMHIFFDSNEP